ncbi:TPA: hypothetical protein L9K56_004931 [Klebsiella pneumoniae]|nr:hypothetical protein [Klebsiella pneumoniae]
MILPLTKFTCVLFIFLGLSAGADFLLSHGFAEAWPAWKNREWEVCFAVIFIGAGAISLTVIFVIDFLADRRRYRNRKVYGERYK